MRCWRGAHDHDGFTLLECMVAATLIALLAAIAVPNLLALMPKYRLNGATREILGDLMEARMKAISLNRRVQVFFKDSDHYEICDDANNDGTIEDCEGTAVIKHLQANYPGITLGSTNNPIFSPRGTATNLATITVTNASKESKTLTISITGRVKIN